MDIPLSLCTAVDRAALACGKCLSVDIALSLDLTTISYRDHLPSSLKLKVPVRAHSGVNPHASGPTASQPPTGETLGGTKTTINKAAKRNTPTLPLILYIF